MKKISISIITILVLIISLNNIIRFRTKDEKIENQIQTITTTISTDSINNTTITKKPVKTSKNTQKKTNTSKPKINESEITTYLYQKVIEQGWTDKDYNAIVNIIIKESSFNIYSVNSKSGACGLFQAYPCSKMKSYGNDYKTNYKVQINWGIDYIKNRYKTPTNAWKFWQEHKWY